MQDNNLSKVAWILGLCLIISAVIGAGVFYKVKGMDRSLTVTGSAKKTVTADVAKWTGSFARTVFEADLKSGYSSMANDLKVVKKFFTDRGIKESDLVISPIYLNQQYRDPNSQGPQQYILNQTVEIQMKDIKKITDLAKDTQALINQGVIFSPQAPEYYYSNLPQTRIDLLTDAVNDARARADKIASAGGRKVGSLKTADVGVTQVTSVNSIDITDYGTYDTSKPDKDVMITVKTTFSLE
ncbi:MAG: SIMPL domain-containing protein [Candidatus Falkowbacteria bacterium]|nr:SIMPL domain-containing protein [Candidatus Falkowbacteria bacterium]